MRVTDAQGVHCVTDDGDEIQGGLPFGASAPAGSGISFISADWVRIGSKLKSIAITPSWVGLPGVPFERWYEGYMQADEIFSASEKQFGGTALTLEDFNFRVLFSLMQGNTLTWRIDSDARLFEPGSESLIAPIGETLRLDLDCDLPPDGAVPDNVRVVDWPWHVHLALTQSFHDELYRRHLTLSPGYLSELVDVQSDTTATIDGKAQTITQTSRMPSTRIVAPSVWNRPYIPQWKSVQIDYMASDDVISNQQVRTPFGWAQSDDEYRGATTDVYLGVDAIEAKQMLSMYWELKSPGAVSGISWEYLANGEKWIPFGPATLDETDRLAHSGLWSVIWPGDASRNSTGMPSGRYWLRARISGTTSSTPRPVAEAVLPSLPRLLGLAINASVATLADADLIAASHFEQPLPPETVTNALEAPDGVLQVVQLWPSFGGRSAESSGAFNNRVARRLRHRARALDSWDLATLLRGHHPGIREVAVLALPRPGNDNSDPPCDGTLPQRLVVMPNVSSNDSDDSLCPVYSEAHLLDLHRWLVARVSPWLTVSCVNPHYRPVRVSWIIRFRTGISPSYGDNRVRRLLEDQLRPWMSGKRVDDPVIGHSLTRRRVRQSIMQIDEVEKLEALWIDGDDGTTSTLGGQVKPDEVAVIECVPPAYHGLGIVALRHAADDAYRSVRIGSDATVVVRVAIDVHPIQRIGGGQQAYLESPTLYNIDTGEVIPVSCERGLCASGPEGGAQSGDTKNVNFDAACVMSSHSSLTTQYFRLEASRASCGVYRIGVVWGIKQKNNSVETLRSGQIGQWIVVEVVAALPGA
ncbi:hypothetical protein BamMEX5DRAFT_2662 [Burkholderia ambifaria MEX-5]|uniref:Uncharacterized protein n=1 Tax=Burkholderia ambifaria MEX-5 TaxID=396597 RepID=B1T4E6_9BURK|nr:hypothetical protein BamMEX5DRAFT_2662 [Burkholderia ambifaria MEX-5]